MKPGIVILHGWGLSGEKYSDIKNLLQKKGYVVFAPDMPGFGKEPLIKKTMTVSDYVGFTYNFLRRHKLKKIILIGHSFGGRIGAKFALKYPKLVDYLILTGAPLIREPLSFKKRLLSTAGSVVKPVANLFPNNLKKIFRKILYLGLGEWDYYKSTKLKKTFVAVINEDLSGRLSKIIVPTLLLWGDNDTFVSLNTAKKINSLIRGSKLEIISGASHKLPYEKPAVFVKKIIKFIK